MIAEVFEKLLYSLDQEGRELRGDEWEGSVAVALNRLRGEYELLTHNARTVIDYSDLATQAAYTYAYAIGRAEFTYQLLKRHRAELGETIFKEKEARITSLGGGPGSEIAGVVKYLMDESNGESVETIKYWIFDKDENWSHPSEVLAQELSHLIPIRLVFDTLDLSNRSDCSKISLKGDDLLILSFVMSELCALDNKSDILESFRSLYKTLDTGAFIFYNDSNASSFYYFFNDSRKFVKGLGMASQKSEIMDNITIDLAFGEIYEHYNDIFGSTPHMNSNALSKLLQIP